MLFPPHGRTAAVLAGLLLCLNAPVGVAAVSNPSANIDQARNGTTDAPITPVHFQNGNAGAQNSHYLEGQSIAYRVRLDGLALGTHSVTIGWDVRQGGKNALDYVTGPNRLEPHSQFLPPHPAEIVDPLEGLKGNFAGPNRFAIPPPLAVLSGQPLASFNALPAADRDLWIYNGTGISIEYVLNADGNLGDLTAAASESRMKITFNARSSSVVIAFGGHIASQDDWGAGNSASAINGSPYHARVISLDNASIGNQDRSLTTDAVLGCHITGPPEACLGTTQTFTETSNETSGTYAWSLTNNSSGAAFVGGYEGSACNVNVGQAVGGTEGFTVNVTFTSGHNAAKCGVPFTVHPKPIVDIAGLPVLCPDAVGTYTGPTGMSSYHWSVTGGTIQGAADAAAVVVQADHQCNGTLTLTLEVKSRPGCPGRGSMTVNVRDTQAPVIQAVGGPATIECPATPQFSSPSTSDDCGGAVQLTYADARSAGRCPNEYSVTRTWTATDACGNASTASQTVTIVDHTAPVIAALPEASTIECPAAPGFATASASDACDANPRLAYQDVLTPGSCAGAFSVTRTWTATDACGNASTARQVIQVVDRTAPVFAALPPASTIECPAVPAFATASATDACDANPRLGYQDVTTPGSCAGQYSITRTWTATDACGNASLASQTINVVDHTAPVLTCPADMTVPVCQNPVAFTLRADDACGGPVVIEATPPSGSTFAVGDNLVNVVARDACGNESRCSFHVHVLGNPAGEITGPASACAGSPATLTGPAGFDYLWNTGANTQSILVSATGNYTLRITDPITGCSTMLSHAFETLPQPVASISGDDIHCTSGTSQLCGPIGNFDYLWTGPGGFSAVTRCIDVAAAGSYQLVIADHTTGCRSAAVSKAIDATPCLVNCPHTIGWWMAQCGSTDNGSVKYTQAQIAQIYSCVDDRAAIFNWTNDVASFCATINPPTIDQRTQAKRQFAGFLANMCTSQLGIVAVNGDGIVISPGTPISFTGFTAHTIGDLVLEADQRLVALEPQQLKKTTVQTQYSQIIDAFDALNNNRIPGSTCPAASASLTAGPTNAVSPSGADDAAKQPGQSGIRLYAPSPNPFTGSTHIAYVVGGIGENVDLAVFDIAGRRIRQIARGYEPAGRHEVDWDGRSENGQSVQGGVYFVRASVGNSTRVMPLVRMR